MTGWQPIETAPKEVGAEIIGWVWRHGTDQALQMYLTEEGRWCDYYDYYDGTQPTHWMPFPGPPGEDQP